MTKIDAKKINVVVGGVVMKGFEAENESLSEEVTFEATGVNGARLKGRGWLEGNKITTNIR